MTIIHRTIHSFTRRLRILASSKVLASSKGLKHRGPSRIRLFASSVIDSESGADVHESTSELSVEQQYVRKTPLEHVLLRPGMYVGPTERLPPQLCWALDPTPLPPSDELLRDPSLAQASPRPPPDKPFSMIHREFSLIPALGKIFDEILVNASDNRLRHPKSCTRIDVVVEQGSIGRDPFIRIFNDGKGIPVQIHKVENMYVPEMLFGHLLTGSNFDDNQKRVTGGRHGYGAKLTNIFSKFFCVETVDSVRKKRYQQIWRENMTQPSEPEITALTKDRLIGDYTAVSFVPDMARLYPGGSGTIPDEDYNVMCRRVVDVAGCAAGKLTVTLNGVDVSLPSFADYVSLYRPLDARPVSVKQINARWSVGIGLSASGSFESVSFVNGMATSRGGTHVNAIVQQVAHIIQEKIKKKDDELEKIVTPTLIRRNLFVAVNALIENPTFDSQMKENLTSSPTSFGSSCQLPKRYLDELVRSESNEGPGIMEAILRAAHGRQQEILQKEVSGKRTKRQLSISKLEDAHLAGSDGGHQCTLILTEGDSAKALAVAGLEVIGRKKFGVFPLRGKFLNVREASVRKLADNAEVKALCAIIGLEFGRKYGTAAERCNLRYGHVMIMTDQDQDGSHIKGLVINFFRYFWPELLLPPTDQPTDYVESGPFLSSFVTPLLKARKGKETRSFYSLGEFSNWRSSLDDNELFKWSVKYYKGLGTSTPSEAKEYFAAFDKHVRHFHWKSERDGEQIDMVFDKQRAADRREWMLNEFDENSMADINPDLGSAVSYEDFINKEMIQFSHADNIRSIPSVVDGLKPSQRKVLYGCFKRKLTAEIKVAQLTGYCAEHTAYHHGEASLQSTIIGMAQDFVGSNNINLLVPSGQFGTRMNGGEDAASPRYIFTFLSPLARYLFPEVDDVLLRCREDDGQKIEPEFFCPVIPLLLVNGSQGIGTGWSTFIPPHNALDIVDYIRARLDGSQELPVINVHARGFTGRIAKTANGFATFGRARQISDTSILIEELPVRTWTNTYKDHLLKLRERGEISGFVEDHTTSTVSFTVTVNSKQLKQVLDKGLDKAFKLEASLPTTNMHAFDSDNKIRKFDTAESIVDAFFPVRLDTYRSRYSVLQSAMAHSAAMLRSKARFIEAVSTNQFLVTGIRKTKDEMVADLERLGFLKASELNRIKNDASAFGEEISPSESIEDSADISRSSEFDYLLNMPLSTLTVERIEELQREAKKKEDSLAAIRGQTAEHLWRSDLDRLASML